MFSKTAIALLFAATAALAVPVASGFGNTAYDAAERINPPTWNLIMTVKTDGEYNEFVIDRYVHVGDCTSSLKPAYFEVVSETQVVITYDCQKS